METTIIYILDLFGTFVFALTGAVKGVRKNLDILGVTVLACCVGVGGGMTRDALIGATPVAALQNEAYLLLSIVTGLVIFFTARYWTHLRNIIQIGDAIGLGVFTAIGAAKGTAYDLSFIGVILSGVLTAIGGGVIRDVFVGTIPAVLKSDFYATAALLGGVLYYLLAVAGMPFFGNFLLSAGFVTGIRLLAIRYKVSLPKAHERLKKPGAAGGAIPPDRS